MGSFRNSLSLQSHFNERIKWPPVCGSGGFPYGTPMPQRSQNPSARASRIIRKWMKVLTRPMRRKEGKSGLSIQAYRGYGSEKQAFISGRVFYQPGENRFRAPLLRDIYNLFRRFLRWGVSGADITVSFGHSETTTRTDRNGFFQARVVPEHVQPDEPWQSAELSVRHPKRGTARGSCDVLTPSSKTEYVVVSDIDDTVVHTGVANFFIMMWRLFAQNAESRVAFPGAASLYRTFHAGSSGRAGNPMLYVSRGPWSIYEVLDTFFNMHRIPAGPVLFLRYWGLTLQHPLPRKAEGHKRDLILRMLEIYPDYPFILVGDSGQHDPETYAEVVRTHPRRVHAIYIRDVSVKDSKRADAIQELADEVSRHDCQLLLAPDSLSMARHAADNGYIRREAVKQVAE